MIKLWQDMREVYNPGETKLDVGKITQFGRYLEGYFHPTVCHKLVMESINGSLGMENEKKEGEYRGTYPKRVQQWLLKNYDVQISDKSNIINDLLGKVHKNQIPETLYARFAKKIDWNAGNFGDSGSCYWGCNAITRYFLSNWNCFQAMCFYTRLDKMTKEEFDQRYQGSPQFYWQDGWVYKGYGRCLTALHFPFNNVFLMWNAYPNGEMINQYLSAFFNGISQSDQELGKKLSSKQVSFTNKGEAGGWFYTNGRACLLVGLEEELNKIGTSVDLGYNGKPNKNALNEYVCECIHCMKRGVWSDRPSIDGKICEYCITNHQVTCSISGRKGFGPSKDRFDLMDMPSVFKLVQDNDGRNLWVCPEEFEKLDMSKYTALFKKKNPKKELVAALVEDMPDMADDFNEEDYDDGGNGDDYDEDEYEDD